MAAKGRSAKATIRARCATLAQAVTDVARADGATIFVPSPDLRVVAIADGAPPNPAVSRYTRGLEGASIAAFPVFRALREGHACTLHRDDELRLLPAQHEVLTLLGIETLVMVPSNPVEGWRYGATFSYRVRLDPEFETMRTVQKLLDAEADSMYAWSLARF